MTHNFGDYQITTIVTGGQWHQSCYLVHHLPSDEQVLVDPGGAAGQIAEAIVDHGRGLKNILITHAHHDHISAIPALHKRFGVQCYLHKDDLCLMRQAQMYALVFNGSKVGPFTLSCLCDSQKALEIGTQAIKMFYTPGHTRGSVCYCFGDFIFTGDTVLYQHIGRTDTPGSNLDQLLASVSYLLKELPADTVIFPGHGRAWTVGEAQTWWQEESAAPAQYKRFCGI